MVALVLRALAKQHFDTLQVESFPLRWTLGGPSRRSGSEPLENQAGCRNILFVPDRMILRHRFTPVGEREVRSNLLGLAKVLGSIVVFEIMELSQAVEKVWLCGCRP